MIGVSTTGNKKADYNRYDKQVGEINCAGLNISVI